jgi:hypothetical protein
MPKSKDPIQISVNIRESIEASNRKSRRVLFHNLRGQFGWQAWTASRKELVAQLLKDQGILAQPSIADAGLYDWIMLSMPIITSSSTKDPVSRPDDKSFHELINVHLGPEREVETHYVSRLFHTLDYEDIHEALGLGFLLYEGVSHKRVEADFIYFANGDHSIPGGKPLVLIEAKSAGQKLDAAIEQAKSYANKVKPMYYAVTNGDVFILWNYQGAIPDVKVLEFRRDELKDRYDEIYRLLNRETATKDYEDKVRWWTKLAAEHITNA